MNLKTVQTKTEQVAETLRKEILHGNFPDGSLPSKIDLEKHFQVSHRTIDLALKRLRDEGLIRGVRGTGIFVNQNLETVLNLTPRLVLILLPPLSVYEDEPFKALRIEALKQGVLPVHLNMPSQAYPLSLAEKANLTQLFRAPIRGVLYNGRSYHREPFLDQWANLRSVALSQFDSEKKPPGSSVLIDFRAGGEKMAKHFIENGAKKLAVLSGYISPYTPKSKEYWKNHISTQFLDGARKAAREAGCPEPDGYFAQTKCKAGITPEEFSFLASNYDGIICSLDTIAYNITKYAEQSGIRIPDDLMVSGGFDTFWCRGFSKQITSLNHKPAEISTLAFNILESGGIHHLQVEPELVIRETTDRTKS